MFNCPSHHLQVRCGTLSRKPRRQTSIRSRRRMTRPDTKLTRLSMKLRRNKVGVHGYGCGCDRGCGRGWLNRTRLRWGGGWQWCRWKQVSFFLFSLLSLENGTCVPFQYCCHHQPPLLLLHVFFLLSPPPVHSHSHSPTLFFLLFPCAYNTPLPVSLRLGKKNPPVRVCLKFHFFSFKFPDTNHQSYQIVSYRIERT